MVEKFKETDATEAEPNNTEAALSAVFCRFGGDELVGKCGGGCGGIEKGTGLVKADGKVDEVDDVVDADDADGVDEEYDLEAAVSVAWLLGVV